MPTLQSEFLYHGVHRLSYGWQNPNFAAAVIVCLLPLIWVLTDLKTQKGGGGVYLTWLAEILLGLMLVWTFSRGAVLAWAVSVVVYGLVFPRLGDNGPKPSVSRQHLLLRLIILGIAASSNGVLGRFASVAEGDASAVNRLELWSGGLSMLRYAPLTGWGSGNSGLAFMQWFQNPASTFGVGGMVNSYLWFAVEHGLPALFLALLAFVMPCSLGFLQTEIQSGARQLLLKGAVTGLICFMVSSVFSTFCELLGICERKIMVKRPVWCRVASIVRSPLPTDPKTIGEHLHKRRAELGLTQRQVANQMGVWLATLVCWEGNRHQPTSKARARIVAWLGFDPRQPK